MFPRLHNEHRGDVQDRLRVPGSRAGKAEATISQRFEMYLNATQGTGILRIFSGVFSGNAYKYIHYKHNINRNTKKGYINPFATDIAFKLAKFFFLFPVVAKCKIKMDINIL